VQVKFFIYENRGSFSLPARTFSAGGDLLVDSAVGWCTELTYNATQKYKIAMPLFSDFVAKVA